MDYQGFGNGSSGAATLSGTDAPIDSSCSGAAADVSLSATNASFAAGKIVFIHQTRGTGADNWELNIIDSYTAGTITTTFDLVNTYTDSGNSQAQVIQVPEYSSVTVSGTLTAKAWDGNVGGIIIFFCSGDTNVSGTITANGKGFRGGAGGFGTGNASTVAHWASQGEGNAGAGSATNAANGNGGGGAHNNRGPVEAGTSAGQGGSGGNGVAGTNGANGGHDTPYGGTTSGSANLSTMSFGGGGGGGGSDHPAADTGGTGGAGGGIIIIFSSTITVTGSIQASGGAGQAPSGPDSNSGGSGGAGGSIYIVTQVGIFGSSLLVAVGGNGVYGTGSHASELAPSGAIGRIAIESCTHTGTTNPSATEVIGGHDFCQAFIHIY